ncbi:WD40 repeat domain-containing protein [Candidatus Poribacteria bacterium]|nr:WD40 repeat domain-containing protein [Candidatus Poribacteria bacterium]
MQIGVPEGAIARFSRGVIRKIDYSPDGAQVAVTTSIGVWLHDAQTGKELDLKKRYSNSNALFSPDHKRYVTYMNPITWVQLWNSRNSKRIKTLTGHKEKINTVKFSLDSNTIATASDDKTIRLWDARTGKYLKTLTGHTAPIRTVEFSPDGEIIASGSADKTIRLWNRHTGKLIKTFTEAQTPIEFSPDGKVLLGRSRNPHQLQMLNVMTGELIKTLHWSNLVCSAAFSADSNIIATGSADKTARLWNANTGESIRTLTGHTDTVYTPVFSPDGNKLVTHCNDSALRLWDINTGKNIITHQREKQSVNFNFSPDSRTLAIATEAGDVSLWNTNTGKKIRTFVRHSQYVHPPLFSSNGNTMVTYSKDRSVRLWNVHTGENINTLNIMGTVNSVLHAPDGELIAITSHKETVSMWNVETGQLLKEFEGDKKRGLDILRRFSLGKKQKRRFGAPPEHIRKAKYSPNGKSVATVRNNKSVQMWDISIGKRIGKLINPPKDDPSDEITVTDIVYAPDGNTFATVQLGNLGGTVRLWETSTGKLLKTLKGYTYCGNSLIFSPDSKTIATGHWDGTVLLWDIPAP